MDKRSGTTNREKIRALKFLNSNHDARYEYSADRTRIFIKGAAKHLTLSVVTFEEMHKEGMLKMKSGTVKITDTGSARLKRALFPENPFTAQQSALKTTIVNVAGKPQNVLVNENESPLSRLHLRKDRHGKSWIDAHEFQAGEKLRSDFEKAQLQPRISASWEASVAGKNRANNTSADLSDFAIDARARVEKAIVALGPELADIVLDVCCFLKGLEAVEKSRGWPPRSAKLMLKTALSALVRHYGMKSNNHKSRQVFWGAEGYRPQINR